MKCVLTIASIDPRFGGPSRSVPALGGALASLGVEVELITLQEGARGHLETAGKRPNNFKITRIATTGSRYLPFLWKKRFRATLSLALNTTSPSLLHDNGVWLPTNHYAVKTALHHNVPCVISPRGMLSDWALASGKWRKKAAWSAYQKRDLQLAHLLHATSEQEAEEFSTLGLHSQVAVVPNGVELPPPLTSDLRPLTSAISAFQSLRVSKPQTRTALFLSRIHPKKGLGDLVRAWANVRPVNWRMVIAGNDEGGHQREIEQLAKSLGVRGEFDFIGPVKDEAKWNVYRRADVFVLPSYSENFGIVIAEALACGVPVITTRATPWQEIEQHRCGWWVETGANALTEALRTALALNADELHQMGKCGKALMERNYSWPSVARRMLTAYEQCLSAHSSLSASVEA